MSNKKNNNILQIELFNEYILNKLMQGSLVNDPQSDLTPVTYKGIYSMHKYWGKKPHNIVRSFIKRYTEEGHIVMDPFCGSGVTAIEALLTKRKAIAIDLNPIATFITRAILLPVDPIDIEIEYKSIRNTVEHKINELYLTRCTRCGTTAVGTHFIWECNVMKKIWYHCKVCGERKGIKTPDQADYERVCAIETQQIPYFYPQTPLYENSRLNAYSGMTVADLFTKRNLMALSMLLHEIEKVKDNLIRDVLKFTFTSCLAQGSKMIFVVKHRGKTSGNVKHEKEEVGSWVTGFWIPNERFEINVWQCFENRFRKVLNGKKEVFQHLSGSYLEAETFEDLMKERNILIDTRSATDLSHLPDESVDYIFTDPPHGDRIPDLELSLMWMSWLQMKADFGAEIVVSNAKRRKKNIEDYQRRLFLALREMHRVLKRGRYMSVAFNSWDEEVWDAFIAPCRDLGFEIVDIAPVKYSAASVLQDSRERALRNDFVLTFRK
jgi:adenine-specific DNA methylase